jgi:hypothetical protein
MKPLPWSYTALSDFTNCPRQYHEKRVLKSVVEEKTEQQLWGEWVHKQFEDRNSGAISQLPDDLAAHEEFVTANLEQPGSHYAERRIALNLKAQACDFWDKDVWFRGVIDYSRLHGDTACLIDYKTGKVKNDFKQLKLFAIHTFTQFPEIEHVWARYYWTVEMRCTDARFHRSMLNKLWDDFIPDLMQYKTAFAQDTWQPRPSGLCHGWCPVKHCDHWKPKREKR